MLRNLLSLLIVLALCLACNNDDEALDCPNQSDRTVDVLAGPLIGGAYQEHWVYLSNEYGGRGVTEEVSAYPVFMDWLGGCQDEYTANLLTFQHEYGIVGFPSGNSVFFPEQKSLLSFWGLPAGQAVNLQQELLQLDNVSHNWSGGTIIIEQVPTHKSATTVPYVGLEKTYDAATTTYQIEVPSREEMQKRFIYLAFRMENEDYQGILIDLAGPYAIHDFAEEAVPMVQHQMDTGESIDWVRVSEIVDAEQGHIVDFGTRSRVQTDGRPSFLLPQSGRSFLIQDASIPSADVEHYRQVRYEELPAVIAAPTSLVEEANFTDRYLSVKTTGHLFLTVTTNNFRPIWSIDMNPDRAMYGPLQAGQHRIRIPEVTPVFSEKYPDITFPTTVFQEGFSLDFWHFPALEAKEDYLHLEEASWLAQQQYFHYRVADY